MYRVHQCYGPERESNVKYAIGMILRKKYVPHWKSDTGDDGIVVITGWMYKSPKRNDIPNQKRAVLYNVVSDDNHQESKMIKQGI